jgi:hypothetical protein
MSFPPGLQNKTAASKLLGQKTAPDEEAHHDGFGDFHAQLDKDVDHKSQQDILRDREVREEIDNYPINQGKRKGE